MQITLNGEPVVVPSEMTLTELVDQQGLANAACATEVNRTLVPKNERDDCTISLGDSIEIVTLVGGG